MAPYKIVVFAGDHCGPEVTNEAVKILKTLSASTSTIQFDLQDHLLGGVRALIRLPPWHRNSGTEFRFSSRLQ